MNRSENWWNKLIRSPYTPAIILGLALRVGFSFITAHPDVWSLDFARYHLLRERIWNFWDYVAALPATHPLLNHYGHNFFTYPPLAYFAFGFFGWLVSPFAGREITPWIIENYPEIYRLTGIGWKLFWLKAPYLLFDLGIAFCLLSMVAGESKKRLVWWLWWLNPLSLYAGYLVGQFELMPTFFVVLALALVAKKKPALAALSLGIGGGFKMFPLFFLPLLAVHQGKKLKEQLTLFVIGLAPFFLSILPYLKSAVFRAVVLTSNQSEKFLFMKLPVSSAEAISLFIFLWGIIFFRLFWSKKEPLWWSFLAVMTAFFGVTHYHPQWFVWLTPLLILAGVEGKRSAWSLIIVMMGSWLVLTLMFEPSLNYAFFLPLRPSLATAKPLRDFINPYYDVFQLMTLVRSLFAAAGLALVWHLGREKNEL